MPQELEPVLPDEEAREEKRKQMRKKLEQILSPEKTAAYVREQMGQRQSMLASELPLAQGDTFIRMIYIRLLYGQRKQRPYQLTMKGQIQKDGFRFRDFEIRLKK